MLDFRSVQSVVCDMDGVLWRGTELLPGFHTLFTFLKEINIPIVLATNNSARHPEDYVTKLAQLGVEGFPQTHILSSGTASAFYLQKHFGSGKRIYVVGGDGLRRVMEEAGYQLADDSIQGEVTPGEVEIVVVGIDRQLSYEKLYKACLLIRAGATFIGTNPDVTFPTPEGLAPGAGSIVGLLEIATDVKAEMIGKPKAPMFESALEILGTAAAQSLMIGDRLNTDIEGAQALGMRTALVLSGVATQGDLAAETQQRPDGVYQNLADLCQQWQASLA